GRRSGRRGGYRSGDLRRADGPVGRRRRSEELRAQHQERSSRHAETDEAPPRPGEWPPRESAEGVPAQQAWPSLVHLRDRFLRDGDGHPRLAAPEGEQEGIVAEDVRAPRNPLRMANDEAECRRLEEPFVASDLLEAVEDVGLHLIG